MSNLSFFGRPPYMGLGGHAHRISTYIRAVQMAERLDAKFNPDTGYENDVCVYVKPCRARQPIETVRISGARKYIDIVDDVTQLKLLTQYPDARVIACSDEDYLLLKKMRDDMDLRLIPQQHCNFENATRDRKGVSVIGSIGGMFQFPQGLLNEFRERGLAFIQCSNFFTRQDVINFYTSIDIQIVWRPWIVNNRLSNPLKIVNAASFGIPTVALYEKTFDEVAGAYKPARNLEDLLLHVDTLRTFEQEYKDCSERGLKIAEEYHIDKIGEMYKEL